MGWINGGMPEREGSVCQRQTLFTRTEILHGYQGVPYDCTGCLLWNESYSSLIISFNASRRVRALFPKGVVLTASTYQGDSFENSTMLAPSVADIGMNGRLHYRQVSYMCEASIRLCTYSSVLRSSFSNSCCVSCTAV
jgi:hypothetical protein